MAKHRRPRGRKGGWTGLLLSFLLGAALVAGVHLLLVREGPLSPEPLSEKISRVDQIVRSQLFETGLSKKDIMVQRSSVRREGSMTWHQSVIHIKLPRSLAASKVESRLKRNLSPLGKQIYVEALRKEGHLVVEVKVQGNLTHQLTFVPPAPELQQNKAAPRAKVAIVIDDLGRDNQLSREILRWDLPVTLSILPFEPYSKSLAIEGHRRNKEIILHLPMEPHGYPETRPGEGVLLREMDEAGLLDQLSRDIESVPYVQGVSNHMGSRFMEDSEKVNLILSELKRRHLFFLDSRTTPKTVGLLTAQALGLRATERDVFLDHVVKEEAITQSVEQLVREALAKGKAVGIGHPHPVTLKVLRKMIPRIQQQGIEIVSLSALLDGTD